MRSFAQLFKCSLALAPVGGFAYLNSSYYTKPTHHVPSLDGLELSAYFQQYVDNHNLVIPDLYKKFQQKYSFNHFFEKSLLKDLEGLDVYNIFLNKHYHDALTGDSNLSNEEKQTMHKQAKLHCTFTANNKLQSHTGMIHGGFTSTLFDNVAGCLALMACDFAPAVTAYLNVSHENPLNVGTEYVAVVEVDRVEGRKVFLKGKVIDKENKVYTNMESLFIKPKWADLFLKQIYRALLLDKKTLISKFQV